MMKTRKKTVIHAEAISLPKADDVLEGVGFAVIKLDDKLRHAYPENIVFEDNDMVRVETATRTYVGPLMD